MLYETNYYSSSSSSANTSSDLIVNTVDEKMDKTKESKLKKNNTNKLENILNSIQRDTIEYEEKQQSEYLSSSSSSCSSFSASSSPFITSQQSSSNNPDELPANQPRTEYLNTSGSSLTSSSAGLIIDPSITELHKNQSYNYYQYTTSPNVPLESNGYYQYTDHQMNYYDMPSQQQNEQNYASFSPIISTIPTNSYQTYSQQTVLTSSTTSNDYYSNQNIDNYHNQNYYLLNQTNNNNNSNYYSNEQNFNQPSSYYHHPQVNHHLSHQLSYSNETNSLIFNLESNHSIGDLESSNLTDDSDDDDLDSESNDDLSLSYKMEVNNFMILNSQQSVETSNTQLVGASNNKKGPKTNLNRKTYQKKKSKNDNLDQQFLISSLNTNSTANNSMTSNSNTNKRKRKRILNRLQRAEATMREKRRMLKLNKAFEELRKVLPISEFAKNKLSRAETLKSAIEYIEKMSEMLSITN